MLNHRSSALLITCCAWVFAGRGLASSFELLSENPTQGSLILVKVLAEGEVFFDHQRLDKTADGKVVFGVGRDAPAQVILSLKNQSGQEEFVIPIRQREWQVEKVDGLPPAKVTPESPEVLERIAQENALVSKVREQFTRSDYFLTPFIKPAQGRISGVYGSQRILNGEPKWPHFGLDIANKKGTPVVAPIDGEVSLVHPDMYYSGGTLIIDHGYGVSSTYIHLETIAVKPGEKVKQGQLIATMGASGRATGPHLDWRLNWFQTRLDPQLLISDWSTE